MSKNVLVLGSVGKLGTEELKFGGREHAIAWKIEKDGGADEVYCSPGNAGTRLNVSFQSLDELAAFLLHSEDSWFVVPGPEKLFADGIVDKLREYDIPVPGPTKEQAKLETSKLFAKKLMKENGVPTPDFKNFKDPHDASAYLVSKKEPLVLKADGLAAGKGVAICKTEGDKLNTIDEFFGKNDFGTTGNTVLVEEFLPGHEFSYIGFADGKNFIPLPTARDYKRAYDGDEGPNTGGMGAYSPNNFVNGKIATKAQKIMEKVVRLTRFKGPLYGGMVERNGEVYVYEFNVRFGDPESQPAFMLLESDLFQYLDACIDGELDSLGPVRVKKGSAVCVVMASNGYPGEYATGKLVYGLDRIDDKKVMVFHAGTRMNDTRLPITYGGRVLGVTSLGKNLNDARTRAYDAVKKIAWEGAYFRHDIGKFA